MIDPPSLFHVIHAYKQVKSDKPSNQPFQLFLRFVPKALVSSYETQLDVVDHDTIDLESDDDDEDADHGQGHPNASRPMDDLIKVAIAANKLLKNKMLPRESHEVDEDGEGDHGGHGGRGGGRGGRGRGRGRGSGRGRVNGSASDAAGGGGRGGRGGRGRGDDAGPSSRRSNNDAPSQPPQLTQLKARDPTKIKPVFADMCLVINSFPMQNGTPSKPFATQGNAGTGKEPFIFPFWSGRLMPDCELMKSHPQLVAKAAELCKSVGGNHFKLDDRHLSGYLMLSPEVQSTGHKTTLKDDAYDAFTNLGASPDICLDDNWQKMKPDNSRAGLMHTWDAMSGKFVADPLGALTTRLLVAHYHSFWKDLDDEGLIVDGRLEETAFSDRLLTVGSKYSLGASNKKIADNICAGEMVQLVELGQGVVDGNKSDDAGKHTLLPRHCCIIKSFLQFGPDASSQHKVELVKWMPDWSATKGAQAPFLKRVAEILPLDGKTHDKRKKKEKELDKLWGEKAPYSLSFVKKAPKETGKLPLMQDTKNTMGTREPSESHELSSGPSFSIDSLPATIQVMMCNIHTKPISWGPFGKEFDMPWFGRTVKVTLGVFIEENDEPRGRSRKSKQGGGEGTSAGAAGPSTSARHLGINVLWSQEFSSSNQHWAVFTVTGFADPISSHGAGQYSLTFELLNVNYIATQPHTMLMPLGNEKLTYQFSVATNPPCSVTAHFCLAGDSEEEEGEEDVMETDELVNEPSARKRHKVDLSIGDLNTGIALIIQLVDSTGGPAAFPTSINPANAADMIKIRMLVEDTVAAAAKTRKAASSQQVLDRDSLLFELADDRMLVKVTNLKTKVFKITDGDSVDATVDIDVSISEQLFRLTPPLQVVLRSGGPTQIIATSVLPTTFVKGEYICNEVRFHLVDDSGSHFNPWAKLREGHQSKKGPENKGPTMCLTLENFADPRGLAVNEINAPFDKSGYCSPGTLLAYGPVGSHATISASFKLKDVPGLGMGTVSGELVDARIQKIHCGFDHYL